MANHVKTFKFEPVPKTKCTITLELNEKKEGPALSICGTILVFNAATRAYDCTCAGQCIDTMAAEFPQLTDDKIFATLYDIWKNWHLNDLKAGTPAQEAALKEAHGTGELETYDYRLACDYLRSIDLYEDRWDGKAYAYGTGWLYWPLPDEVRDTVQELFDR